MTSNLPFLAATNVLFPLSKTDIRSSGRENPTGTSSAPVKQKSLPVFLPTGLGLLWSLVAKMQQRIRVAIHIHSSLRLRGGNNCDGPRSDVSTGGLGFENEQSILGGGPSPGRHHHLPKDRLRISHNPHLPVSDSDRAAFGV